jgi:hypothetical protein
MLRNKESMPDFSKSQVEFMSGLIGGLTAVTVTAPLEVARNRITARVIEKFKMYISFTSETESKFA